MKQRILIACVAVLAVAAIVFGALYFTNDADKAKTIDALKGEKATLTDDVAGKAEQIAGLEDEKEQLIADHEAALKGKDDEITKLTGEKDQLIADNEKAIREKQDEIDKLAGEKTELEKAVEELNELKKDLIDEKAELEETVKSKDAEIKKLTGEKNQLTADHEKAIKEKEDEINKLTSEKEQLTADHEQAIKDKDDKIQKLENEFAMALAAKDVTIEELENRVEKLQSLVSEMTVLTVDNAVEEAVTETTEAVEEVAEEATEAVEEVAEEATEAVEEAVTETTESVEEAVTETTEAVEEAVTETTEAVEEVAEEATEAVEEAVTETTEAVEEVAEEATEAVEEAVAETTEDVEEAVTENTKAGEEVIETVSAGMTYAEYVSAPVDTPVEVETYVQAKQSWWDNKGTFYTQNEDGAYFIYEMAISEEDYNKLVPGTKILVKGYKAEWSGEVEIVDATFEILEGNWIAEPKDVTSLLGTENLIAYQNQLVAFKSVTIEKIEYKNGEPGDDIYVTIAYEGNTYDFCVERYLTDPETEVYKTVGTLHAGDVVDIEGFLYWYNGVNTHITKVTAVQ